MRMRWCCFAIGYWALIGGPVMLAQSNTSRPQTGDVFSSGGKTDDRRKYVSRDRRNFDRCAYDTANIPNLPETKMYGMPDHVPIDSNVMREYVRCAVDACAVNQKAVCWGKNGRSNRKAAVLPPEAFNTNGFHNCVASGTAVICDLPPKMLELLPAICLAQQGQPAGVQCQPKMLLGGVQENVSSGGTSSGSANYGKKMPAMSGNTRVGDTTPYLDIPDGVLVGQGLAGPVRVRSNPPRFSKAQGFYDPESIDASGKSAVFVITDLRNLTNQSVLRPPSDNESTGETIRVSVRSAR